MSGKKVVTEDVTEDAEVQETAVAPTEEAPVDEGEYILPKASDPIELEGGYFVVARPLRLREFLSFMKIITRGAGPVMASVDLSMDDSDRFVQNLLAVVLMAVPEAEDEVVDFVRDMVEPDPAQNYSSAQLIDLESYLLNPYIEDLISVVERVIQREGGNIQKLGKRLSSLMTVARKTGQV